VSNQTQQPQRPAAQRYPGDALVRLGAIVFVVGTVATMATVLPLLLGSAPLPTAAYLVSMIGMGAGFALALAGILRSALGQRRAVRADRAQAPTQAASAR
jgi:hypothetical protein